MYFFPTVVVDNFFNDPLQIREFALNLDYAPAESSNFSGVRTEDIFETYPTLAHKISAKVAFSCGFVLRNASSKVYFHLTGEEFGDTGWAHEDFAGSSNMHGAHFASVIYLNPDVRGMSGGTMTLKLKNINYNPNSSVSVMHKSFQTGIDYPEERKIHNSQYEEDIRVGGVFNRMISYDARRPHCGFGYFGKNKSEKRLTCLVFFSRLEFATGVSPIVAADMDYNV